MLRGVQQDIVVVPVQLVAVEFIRSMQSVLRVVPLPPAPPTGLEADLCSM